MSPVAGHGDGSESNGHVESSNFELKYDRWRVVVTASFHAFCKRLFLW